MKLNINEKKAKKAIEEKLKGVFMDGMKQGTKSICGIVLEEIKTNGKSSDEKMETLRLFCERSLGIID